MVTYNVYAAIDLRKAPFSDMVQTLELPYDLIWRIGRGLCRGWRPSRPQRSGCRCSHDGGAGRPGWSHSALWFMPVGPLPKKMRIQCWSEHVAHELLSMGREEQQKEES